MSKKLFLVCMFAALSLVMATGVWAFSDLPDEVGLILNSIVANGGSTSGTTAGTFVNPEGKGDVLIFPYYDVRELNGKAQDFFFFIINEENDPPCLAQSESVNCFGGMAAKLRFREWDKSEEVFDVDIWLSRGDVWVGHVTHNTALALPYGARITSTDYVITDTTGGANGGTHTISTPLAGGFDFPVTAFIPGPVSPPYKNDPTNGYVLVPHSPGSNNLYGYFEVIGEENTYDHFTPPVAPSTTLKVTRGGLNGAGAPIALDARNSLAGYAYIVRVGDGSSLAYNATALANFSVNQGSLFTTPGGTRPTLQLDAEDTLDQVEFAMAKYRAIAGYDIEAAIAGQFSFILTFPTKHFHFCGAPNYTIFGDVSLATASCIVPYPTGNPWNDTITTFVHGTTNSHVAPRHANDAFPIDVVIWDRNEHLLTPPKTFVSPPQPVPTLSLFYEVNVLGLYFGTPPAVPQLSGWTVRDNVAIQTTDNTQNFDSGYIDILFPYFGLVNPTNNNARHLAAPKIHHFFNFGVFFNDYYGLPLLPLSLQEFANGSVGGFYGDIREGFYYKMSDDPILPQTTGIEILTGPPADKGPVSAQ